MKIIKKHGDYFPSEDIWLVFDQGNGHPGSYQYTWWFRTEKEALVWIRHHKKVKNGYNVSKPTRWRLQNE